MVLSTPAPHAPFTPAPQYRNKFANRKAPRTPAFNYVEVEAEAKHWFVQRPPRPLNQTYIDRIDEASNGIKTAQLSIYLPWYLQVYRNRLRTLLSVDDMVESVMKELEGQGLLNDTIFIFTSDHGYHLGTFSLTIDKRLPYDTGILN